MAALTQDDLDEILKCVLAFVFMIIWLAFYTFLMGHLRNEFTTIDAEKYQQRGQMEASGFDYAKVREQEWYDSGYGSFNYNSSTPPGKE